MANFTVVDLASWPRREHYEYYTQRLPVGYSMTARLDVTRFRAECRARGLRFYAAFIACVSHVVTRCEWLRMFRDSQGRLCLWDEVCPNYTVFHEDDHTFSDLWSRYTPDLLALYHTICDDMARYGHEKGIKARPDQPGNFFCVSCVPWVDFQSFNTYTAGGQPTFFPIITIGRISEAQEKQEISCAFTIAHAVCDGWHTARFFRLLQDTLDTFPLLDETKASP